VKGGDRKVLGSRAMDSLIRRNTSQGSPDNEQAKGLNAQWEAGQNIVGRSEERMKARKSSA